MGDKCEWKELDIANLPDMTEVYDFQKMCGEGVEADWWDWELDNHEAIDSVFQGDRILYRKRAPKKPSHGELAAKYIDDIYPTIENQHHLIKSSIEILRTCAYHAFLAGRESSDIPPEEENE